MSNYKIITPNMHYNDDMVISENDDGVPEDMVITEEERNDGPEDMVLERGNDGSENMVLEEAKESTIKIINLESEDEETKNIRLPIKKVKRSKIIELQKRRCGICEAKILGGNFDVDHLVPVSLGGTNSLLNLLAICPNCHGIKSRMMDRNLKFLGVTNITNQEQRDDLIEYVRSSLLYAYKVANYPPDVLKFD